MEEKRNGISEGNGENRNGISEGGGENRQRAGRKGRRKSKRWNLARSAGKSEGVRQDHDGGGDSGGCIKDIGNRKFISGSRSASAGTTTTRPASPIRRNHHDQASRHRIRRNYHGQASRHRIRRNHRDRSHLVHFREYPVMIPLTTAISQTAARSDHRTAVPYAEKTAASAATVLSCTDIRISAIFCCAEIPGDSTYWEYPVDTASRNGLWPICLAFPTLRNVRIFISQAEREDTGTVLLTSDQKNFGIHADKQTVLQIRRSQLHTTNFYYRDRLRQDIPVVFHFFLGAGRESRYQNSVGIPVSLEIISFCTA